jgi:hypothetical protein
MKNKDCVMRFLLYFLIIIIFIFNTSCSFFKPIKKEHSLAYSSLMYNETDKARAYLNRARDNYVKKFLLSCHELSEGNIDLAKQYAEEVVHECKELPEGRVLINLIDRRESHPNENWVNSYVFAFRESGSPELSLIENLLFAGYDDNKNEGNNEAKCENIKIPEKYIGTPKELLFAFEHFSMCNNDKYLEILLNVTSEMPFEIKLLALSNFEFLHDDESLKEELSIRIKKKRTELIRQLSTEQVSYMYFAIMDILEQMPETIPLKEDKLKKLEKAVSREKFGPSRFDLFNYYLMLFKDLNASNPLLSAAMVTSSVYPAYPTGLINMTIEPTKYAEEQQKERLTKILEKVAKATLKRRALIDYLIGSSLLMRVSNLRDDKELERKAREIKKYAAKLTFQITSSPNLWPITPLLNETIKLSMEDEIGYFQLFTDEEMPEVISELINEPLGN